MQEVRFMDQALSTWNCGKTKLGNKKERLEVQEVGDLSAPKNLNLFDVSWFFWFIQKKKVCQTC